MVMGMNKRVLKNYIYNLSYQILNLLFPLLTIPYLSRVLGPDGIGNYNYVSSIVSYFILFGNLGVSLYGQREIGYCQKDFYKRSKKFFEIMLIRFLMTLITFIFYSIFFLKDNSEILFYIFIFQFLSSVLDTSWFFYGIEQFRTIVIRNIFIRILGILLIFMFVKSADDLSIYALIMVTNTLLANISVIPFLRKKIQRVKLNEIQIRNSFRPMLYLFIPQMAASIYETLDKVMLGVLSTKEQVGFYSQSQRLIILLSTIITSLGFTIFPKMSLYVATNQGQKVISMLQKYVKFSFIIGFPMVLGLIATAEIAIPFLLSNEFQGSISITRILSLLIIALPLQNAIGTQYLITKKRQKEYNISIFIGVIVNVLFNYILIGTFGGNGAAIASVLAESSVLTAMFYFVKKDISFIKMIKDNMIFIFSSFAMFFIMLFLPKESSFASILMNISVGVALYFSFLFIGTKIYKKNWRHI